MTPSPSGSLQPPQPEPVYSTDLGMMVLGKAEDALASELLHPYRGHAQLIFTSPPFPLNRKKAYGNLTGDEYIDWLAAFASSFRDFLAPDGSIAIELGNSWEPGHPVMSTLPLKTLLAFLEAGDLFLCQQFICLNQAKLPSPAQWVTIERIRVKDAYTNVWWMSSSPRPKASNRRVLTPYSDAMQKLLKTRKYNSGVRPSEHSIGPTSFLANNGGAIPSNVITVTNTRTNDPYLKYCRANRVPLHPARMPIDLASFFINFLTEPGDLVVDPFAGSNVTGAAAEQLGRHWISIESMPEYAHASMSRFSPTPTTRSA